MVALTFDDGPSSKFDIVLTTLAKHNVKATFFLLGERLENSQKVELALKAVDAGHQIENHGWDHSDFMTLSDEQIVSQVNKTNQVLWDKLGVTSRFVRPPYGSIDVPKAMPIWDLGYGVALWNLDSQDYKSSFAWGAEQVLKRIEKALNTASPSTHSFNILLHDWSETSVKKLDDIIISVLGRGYSIVTLDECADSGVLL